MQTHVDFRGGPAHSFLSRGASRAALGVLFNNEVFAAKLKEVVDYYNFQPVQCYQAEAVDYQTVLDNILAVADVLTGMVMDVSDLLDAAENAAF